MRCSRPLLLCAALLPPLLPASATADAVTVEVHNVRDGRGHILVALCTRQTFLTMRCPYHAASPAAPGTVVVRFADVAPGLYSAEAFDDFDDSGALGRSLLGLPDKGLGFSRGARMFFGPPKFADAAFAVAAPEVRVSVTLRYY